MKEKELIAILAGILLLGANSSGAGKLPAGSRLLLIGDSQSLQPGPGWQLAGLLRKAGYEVDLLAVGGKTADYFSRGGGKQALLGALALRPRWVIVFLGTNEAADIALSPAMEKSQVKGHQLLKQLILGAGAKALFVGPPNFDADVKGAGKDTRPIVAAFGVLVPRLRAVYGEAFFLDARPYTPMPHSGIHFGKEQALSFAKNLAPEILRRIS